MYYRPRAIRPLPVLEELEDQRAECDARDERDQQGYDGEPDSVDVLEVHIQDDVCVLEDARGAGDDYIQRVHQLLRMICANWWWVSHRDAQAGGV